jgi:hypothetical protein
MSAHQVRTDAHNGTGAFLLERRAARDMVLRTPARLSDSVGFRVPRISPMDGFQSEGTCTLGTCAHRARPRFSRLIEGSKPIGPMCLAVQPAESNVRDRAETYYRVGGPKESSGGVRLSIYASSLVGSDSAAPVQLLLRHEHKAANKRSD